MEGGLVIISPASMEEGGSTLFKYPVFEMDLPGQDNVAVQTALEMAIWEES